ncbi:MAG: hypothetical protein IKF90_13690 [Parasporobacterium sp.]|nr:hypothetical protein [Parasporobacterium sp.]
MINFRYQILTTKENGARVLLYTARSQKEAVDYIAFLLNKRDLNEPLEYTIKPVIFISDETPQGQ